MEEPKAPPLTADGIRLLATRIAIDYDAVMKSKASEELKKRVAERAFVLQPTLLTLANSPAPVVDAWMKMLAPELSAFYMDVVAAPPGGGPVAPPIGACRHSTGCIMTTQVACVGVGVWSPGPC
jgi:hypothetical protein